MNADLKKRIDDSFSRKKGAKKKPAKPPEAKPTREQRLAELPPPQEFDMVYDRGRGRYWAHDLGGIWTPFNESQMSRLLKLRGYADWRTEVGLSPLQRRLLDIQMGQGVDFAGEIAGYSEGIRELSDQIVLVTRGPKLLEEKKGKWPTLKAVLHNMLKDQWEVFFGWLQASIRSLRAGPPFVPGQALVLAGPRGCGKSLTQSLITKLFGGRSGRPIEYLKEKNTYTDHIMDKEHLMLEDESSDLDRKTRRAIGARIKALVANQEHLLNAKFKTPIVVTPFLRLTISVNDDAHHLQVLPPLEESLTDKISILKCHPVRFPFKDGDIEGRKRFGDALVNQLPAFVYDLMRWKIPQKLMDQRYIVKAFHNPEIMQKLQDLSDENRLLELIDLYKLCENPSWEWAGDSKKLEHDLRERDKSRQVDQLLHYHTACGQLLGKLCVHRPDRVTKKPIGQNRLKFTIKKEPGEEEAF